jgi:phosphatidylglycerophosphatase A
VQNNAKPRAATSADLFSSVAAFLGLGFGSGLAPKAPGTFGTLAAIPVYLALQLGPSWLYITGLIVSIIAGVWICGLTAKRLEAHDHPAIVWDEIAGYLLTMLPFALNIANVVAGFLLFRLFDIVKPWPIKWVDQYVHGGLGIMLDDLLAAVFAALCLWGLILYNPLQIFS